MVPGLITLALLYFALPAALDTGGYVDARLPIAIVLLGLARTSTSRSGRGAVPAALIGLLGVAVVAKQAAIAVLWRSFDPQIDAIAAALDTLPAGAVIMAAECQPDSHRDVMGVYRERQPSMTHLPAMASFDDRRFVAANWAIAGQQVIAVAPAFRPYYELQDSFAFSTCTAAQYGAELAGITDTAAAQAASDHAVPPLYFLVMRPPLPGALSSDAAPIATGRGFELYGIKPPAPHHG